MRVNVGSSTPQVAATAWIAPNATLAGDVIIEDHASVWYGAVLRADCGRVNIGRGSNVQDGCVLHPDPQAPVDVGAGVSIGHGAVVHACVVGDHTLVGMGAVILTGARIGSHSLVAAGSVIKEGDELPDGVLIAGVPAQVKRALTAEERQTIRGNADSYVALALEHARSAEGAAR